MAANLDVYVSPFISLSIIYIIYCFKSLIFTNEKICLILSTALSLTTASSISHSLSRGLKRWGANNGPPTCSKKLPSKIVANYTRTSSSSSIKSIIYGNNSFLVLSFPKAMHIVPNYWTALTLFFLSSDFNSSIRTVIG